LACVLCPSIHAGSDGDLPALLSLFAGNDYTLALPIAYAAAGSGFSSSDERLYWLNNDFFILLEKK